jgi:ferredoxin--NADP+ reductase
VFKSVGYRGVALPGIPFDRERGVVPNSSGRVVGADGAPLEGLYVVGWIKRGSTGVIGTNKTDARETVRAMLEDRRAGRLLAPGSTDPAVIDALISARQPSAVSYARWRRLDEVEVRRGLESDRPRVKFTDVAEMLDLLGL